MPIVLAQPEPFDAAALRNQGLAEMYARLGGGHAGGGGGHGGTQQFNPGQQIPQGGGRSPGEGARDTGGGEDPVDRQLRLQAGQLSMAENLRMQRLEQAKDEIQNDENLSEKEKADALTMVTTGLDPLQRRRAAAQLAEQEAHVTATQNFAAQQEAIRAANAKAQADGLSNEAGEIMHPGIRDQATQFVDEQNPELAAWGNDVPQAVDERERLIWEEARKRGGTMQMMVRGNGERVPIQYPFEAQAARAKPNALTVPQMDRVLQEVTREVDQQITREARAEQTQPGSTTQVPYAPGMSPTQRMTREQRIQATLHTRLQALGLEPPSNLAGAGTMATGVPPGTAPTGAASSVPAFTPTPAIPDDKITTRAGVPDYSQLPPPQISTMLNLDRYAQRIDGLPAAEMVRFQAPLSAAREMYRAGLKDADEQRQFDALLSILDTIPVPSRTPPTRESLPPLPGGVSRSGIFEGSRPTLIPSPNDVRDTIRRRATH